MDREISNGTMLGIVLIVLAAIIVIGFVIFTIMKGVANDGTNDVQDSLGQVSTQVFIDYDQKVIAGSKIISGLKNFEGKPYAVLVSTSALQKGAKLNRGATVVTGEVDTKKAYPMINYNALLAADAAGEPLAKIPATQTAGATTKATATESGTVTSKGVDNIIKYNKGTFILKTALNTNAEAEVLYDTDTEGLFKTGNTEFISQTAKFKANLIKNESDVIVGITAYQLK